MRGVLSEPLAEVVARARSEGRDVLLETEGLTVARALGLRVPVHRLVGDAREARRLDLAVFPGERLVVKVASAGILHKSDVGGVRVVAKSAEALGRTVAEMETRFAGLDGVAYGIFEHVAHESSLGGELLLGARWTDDFGPIVTFGPGGVDAERLAGMLRPERGAAILSPALATDESVRRALEASVVGGGRRGPGVDPRAALDLLRRFLAFAAEVVPALVSELEINPVAFVDGEPVALDALARLAPPGRPDGFGGAPARPLAKIARLLAPERVAVVGVSRRTDPPNPGRIVLRNLLAEGFDPERLWVVKPGVAEIDGCRAWPDLASLPGPVDLLVVAVDAVQVPDLVEEVVARALAESLVILPGGMGEADGTEERARRVRACLDRARSSALPGSWGGPVVNGGNCLGVRSVPGRVDTLFIPRHKLSFDRHPAPLAVISQSGAFAVARASRLAVLAPRYLVTVGNQLDLTVGDYLTYLEGDPEVRVFACAVEGFQPGDGLAFVRAARRITASGRCVILYRAARTAAGARASASHTASIAGDYAVTRALAREAGVLLAESLADFDDLVALAVRLDGRQPAGRRVGIVTNAGFESVALADGLGPLELAELGEEAARRLGALIEFRGLGGIVGVRNPLDTTPMLDDEGFAEAVRAMLEDDGVDLGVVGCVPLTGALRTVPAGPGHAESLDEEGSVVRRLAALAGEVAKPWVAVVDAGPLYDPMARRLEAAGVPVFRTADRAIRLLGAWAGAHLTHH